MKFLRTCKPDMTSYKGTFTWPTSGSVKCPDWNPEPICGGGLHGLKEGKGRPPLLNWAPDAKWILFEADTWVDIDESNAKVPEATVIYCGDRDGALEILAADAGFSTGREWACQDPIWAYNYAFRVDKEPREDTRAAACKHPQWAQIYAKGVDKAPRDDTRAGACKHPQWAYYYAKNVDKAPRDDTRASACKDPKWASYYARYVDKGTTP